MMKSLTTISATHSTRTEPYMVSAAAPGAWYCRLQVPLDPYDWVCHALETAARLRGLPITAVVRGSDGDVTDLVLLRDPSVLFGTAAVAALEGLVDMLVAATGWRRRPPAPLPEVVIPLGLRRGYAQDAPVHPARPTRRQLVDDVLGVRAWPVRLCSVRIGHDGEPQWWHEPGLLVHADDADQLPDLAEIAAELGQDRFVVTNAGCDTTTAYRRRTLTGG
ncbi:hypothetical protein ACFORH_43365 [Amycolatopsis roodepoortensis]|uniref:Uncharacterized protein n=1 Tax=Amycolatopsis roodepoortensis TaxID=700274 RepID=A0ABR9LID4_9PSEU|nr:hypothetical protein [Amycolatopsis roodepoortensis]MBE1580418.1 hypothetical protein [Amycolatopsis roodepoortensis]